MVDDLEIFFKRDKNKFDDEIKELLNNVKITQYDSINVINDKLSHSIDKIYNIFSNYEKNKLNKEDAIKKLHNFEIIEFDDIKKDDVILCYNLKFFFDLKLFDKFKVTNVLKTAKIIKGLTSINEHIIVSYKPKNVYYKEFDEEKTLKLNLLKYL